MGGHRASPQLEGCVLLSFRKCGQPAGVRRQRNRAALRQVGRLQMPSAEGQIVPVDELEQLRDGVGLVARIQQRIGERVGIPGVARSAKQTDQWVRLG